MNDLLGVFFVFLRGGGGVEGARVERAKESIKQNMVFIIPNFVLIITNLIQSKYGSE